MKLNSPVSHAGIRGRVATGLAVAALSAAALCGGALATSASAEAAPADIVDVVLTVGADEAQRVVSWYATSDAAQGVQLAPTSSLVDGAFPATATTVPGTVKANTSPAAAGYEGTTPGTVNGHAVLTGLKQNTQYSYRVGAEGHWSEVHTFTTRSFHGDFDFLFFGDPQIGSSGNTALDQAGWAKTLETAEHKDPNAELYVSGGDQVNTADRETEWDAFLAPDQLRSTPWVPTIGNHDVGKKNYEQHFSVPNNDASWQYYANGSPSANTSGGNYWFVYKDVLFIDLNSNSYQVKNDGTTGTGDAAHINYVTDVINEHGDEAKWKVLVYHHSIYSPADHANDGDNAVRRADFPKTFSRLGVNLVLQGHDHSYSRSYLIKNGAKADTAEKPGAADVFAGPGGVMYVTANSASGSKYYDLTNPDPSRNRGDYGPDPLDTTDPATGHVRHWANSVEQQEHVPTYVRVNVTNKGLTVSNVRSGDCTTPNAAVQRNTVDEPWCGTEDNPITPVDPADPTKGFTAQANPLGGIGSLSDKVTLHRVVAAPSAVAVHGRPKVGAPLTAGVTGSWTPGTTASYVWKANGVVFGRGSSVVPRAAQLGKRITVEVTGSHALYESRTVTSPASAAVARGTLSAGTPVVKGTAKVGRKLSARPGTWTRGTHLTYRWYANGKAISHATKSSLTLPSRLKGKRISVKVTGSLAGYTTVTKASRSTAAVKR